MSQLQAMRIRLAPGDLSNIATMVEGVLQHSRNLLVAAGLSNVPQALFSAAGNFFSIILICFLLYLSIHVIMVKQQHK